MASSKSKVWEGIRSAEAAAQCKSLAWRACKEELPVKSKMLERGEVEDATCPCCHGDAEETTAHALLLCEEVKRYWFACPLGHRVDALQESRSTTMMQWMDECVGVLDGRGMGMVCAMLWALWHKRNTWVLNRKRLHFPEVMAKAYSMLASDLWNPPPSPFVKANFCASVRDNSGTGFGVVFRDYDGVALASGTNVVKEECYEKAIAEALCYRWVIEKSRELCFTEVIYETECEELHTEYNKAKKKTGSNSSLETLVEECRMMTQGRKSSLRLVSAAANNVAHSIAEWAFDYGDRIWIEEVMDEASVFLEFDFEGIAHLPPDK